MSTTTAHPIRHRRIAGFGHFALHFFEMCMPMCIGWAVGDLIFFAVAAALGSSEPFRDWPELSLAVVTFNMTMPMVAWMRFRRVGKRLTAEMATAMAVLALMLLASGWLGFAAMNTLPWLAHGLMMPAMLVPMLLRYDAYSGAARA